MKRFIYEVKELKKLFENPVGGGVTDAFPLGFGEVLNVLVEETCVALPKRLGETFKVFVDVVTDTIPLDIGEILNSSLRTNVKQSSLCINRSRNTCAKTRNSSLRSGFGNLLGLPFIMRNLNKTHPTPPLQKEGRKSLRGAKRRGNPFNNLDYVTNVSNDKLRHAELDSASRTDLTPTLFYLRRGRKTAFTLAEVLITLGIIGVVAALTIPTVVSNIQHKELEVGFKKAYSSISQALKFYQVENDIPFTSNTYRTLKPAIMPYFQTVRDCGWGYTDANSACIPNLGNPSLSEENRKMVYRRYIGTGGINLSFFDDGQFVINNGMLIMLQEGEDSVFISVDVNGYNKKPNRLGQDLFMFQIDNNGRFLPMGVEGTAYYHVDDIYCSKTNNNDMNGAACTVKALSDKDFFKNMPR